MWCFCFFYQSIYTHDSKLKITDVYVREAVDCCRSVNEALYILVVLAITKYQKLQRAWTCYIKNITLRVCLIRNFQHYQCILYVWYLCTGGEAELNLKNAHSIVIDRMCY